MGLAGHINNHTEIGNAFGLAKEKYSSGPNMIDKLLGLMVYSLIALDTLALELIQNSRVKPLPTIQAWHEMQVTKMRRRM